MSFCYIFIIPFQFIFKISSKNNPYIKIFPITLNWSRNMKKNLSLFFKIYYFVYLIFFMKIKNLMDSHYDKLIFKFRKNFINTSYQVIKQYRLLTFILYIQVHTFGIIPKLWNMSFYLAICHSIWLINVHINECKRVLLNSFKFSYSILQRILHCE